MSEQHPCIRCARAIDAWAKICPYCNWDQSAAPPAQEPPKPAAVTDYRPPSEYDLRRKAMFAGIGVLTLVAAFGVGVVINKNDAPKTAPKTVEEQFADEQQARRTSSIKRADTPLVPMDGAGGIEQPITSAPVAAAPGIESNDYQRSDATAVSATEYAELAKRANAEKKRMAQAVDPRSLTGAAYAQGPAPRPRRIAPPPSSPAGTPATTGMPQSPVPQPSTHAAVRTRPIPQYQPLPHISSVGTARLSLMVGADGRVKQIDIERPLQRNTAQLLSAVQSWRFKPATIDGDPVAAPYSVEISFKQ
jgi:TonB family protein